MLEGIRHSDCTECWRLEDRGLQSYRRTEPLQAGAREFHKWIASKGEGSAARKDGSLNASKSFRPVSIVLFLDNLCDLKCGYCYFGLSSAWEAENRKHDDLSAEGFREIRVKAPKDFEIYFWRWFDEIRESVDQINLVGGEPTLIPNFYKFLDKFDRSFPTAPKKPALSIGLVTNLNCSERVLSEFLSALNRLLPKFSFKVDVSMDAWGRPGRVHSPWGSL